MFTQSSERVAAAEPLSFAGATFHPRSGELICDGSAVPLRPRTAAVLEYLLIQCGRLISKDELLRAVWNDAVVTEDSLTQCIKEIRRALGPVRERLVRTVPRIGYQFAGEVTAARAAPTAMAPPTAASRPVIVALPLRKIGEGTQQPLADGLTEEITTRLGNIAGTRVIARGSALRYRDAAADPRRLHEELGVDYVVEGSVRSDRKRVVVHAALATAPAGEQLWSERIEVERAAASDIREQIAARVARSLRLALINAQAETARHRIHPDKQDLIWQAWSFWERYDPRSNREARAIFERVVERDPKSAPAWAGLATTWISEALGHRDVSTDIADALEHAEAAARVAYDLDRNDSHAIHIWGAVLSTRGRIEEGQALIERRLEIEPNNPLSLLWTALNRLHLGQPERALPAIDEALAVSPRDGLVHIFHLQRAQALFDLRRFDESVLSARRSIAARDDSMHARLMLAAALQRSGNAAAAQLALAEVAALRPGLTVERVALESMAVNADGEAMRARYFDALRDAGLPAR